MREDAPLPPKTRDGRFRIDWRRAISGIIFRLRFGCQWNQFPKQFGDDGSIHRWLQRWCQNGVFATVWAVLVEHRNVLGMVD